MFFVLEQHQTGRNGDLSPFINADPKAPNSTNETKAKQFHKQNV
jgi:hypothetical protein